MNNKEPLTFRYEIDFQKMSPLRVTKLVGIFIVIDLKSTYTLLWKFVQLVVSHSTP